MSRLAKFVLEGTTGVGRRLYQRPHRLRRHARELMPFRRISMQWQGEAPSLVQQHVVPRKHRRSRRRYRRKRPEVSKELLAHSKQQQRRSLSSVASTKVIKQAKTRPESSSKEEQGVVGWLVDSITGFFKPKAVSRKARTVISPSAGHSDTSLLSRVPTSSFLLKVALANAQKRSPLALTKLGSPSFFFQPREPRKKTPNVDDRREKRHSGGAGESEQQAQERGFSYTKAGVVAMALLLYLVIDGPLRKASEFNQLELVVDGDEPVELETVEGIDVDALTAFHELHPNTDEQTDDPLVEVGFGFKPGFDGLIPGGVVTSPVFHSSLLMRVGDKIAAIGRQSQKGLFKTLANAFEAVTDIKDGLNAAIANFRKEALTEVADEVPHLEDSTYQGVLAAKVPFSMVVNAQKAANEVICAPQLCEMASSNCYSASVYMMSHILVELHECGEERMSKPDVNCAIRGLFKAIHQTVQHHHGIGVFNNEAVTAMLDKVKTIVTSERQLAVAVERSLPSETMFSP